MREIRTSGSEGGGTGYSTGPPYPYREFRPAGLALTPAHDDIASPEGGILLAQGVNPGRTDHFPSYRSFAKSTIRCTSSGNSIPAALAAVANSLPSSR